MKKIIISIIFCLMLIPINTKALNGTLKINCEKTTVQSGETVACTINGENFEEIVSLYGMLDTGSYITVEKVKTEADWIQEEERPNINQIEFSRSGTTSGNIKFCTFNIKIGNVSSETNQKISFTKIGVGNKNYEDIALDDISTILTLKPTTTTNDRNEENPNTGAFISITIITAMMIVGIIINQAIKRKIFKI